MASATRIGRWGWIVLTLSRRLIAFLRAIGDPDLADRLERSAAVRRERHAAMVSRSVLPCVVPICRVRMVPKIDDPWMAEWHAPMVSGGVSA